jgi:hypothetical protein
LTANIPLIQINVRPALRLRGSLKAMMPLLMASTPVRAVQPPENARRIKNKVSAWSVSPA